MIRGLLKPILYGATASKVLGSPFKFLGGDDSNGAPAYNYEAPLFAAGSLYGMYDSYKSENKRVKEIIKSHKQDKILKQILKAVKEK